jgi:hypothetical protein
VENEPKGVGIPRRDAEMRSLLNAQHQKVYIMILDMLQDLAVGIANLYESSRVRELFGAPGQTPVERLSEAVTEFVQAVGPIQGLSLNDVEHIDPRSKRLCEAHCVRRRSSSRRGEIRRVQYVFEAQICSRSRPHLGPHR